MKELKSMEVDDFIWFYVHDVSNDLDDMTVDKRRSLTLRGNMGHEYYSRQYVRLVFGNAFFY